MSLARLALQPPLCEVPLVLPVVPELFKRALALPLVSTAKPENLLRQDKILAPIAPSDNFLLLGVLHALRVLLVPINLNQEGVPAFSARPALIPRRELVPAPPVLQVIMPTNPA